MAAIVAVVLAVIGAVLLTVYVRNADARAMAGQQPTSVFVVVTAVPRGTPAELLGSAVAAREIPALAVAEGVVNNLADLAGKVAQVELQPGEQLLGSRFIDPGSAELEDPVPIPKEMEQVSIVLEPQRVIGARLEAGATVGIMGSFSVKDAKDKEAAAIETTTLMLPKVLVTRVQGVAASQTDTPDGDNPAPSDAVMVTLAVSAVDAEKVVFAAEFGKIWLTLERQGSRQDDARTITVRDVVK